MNGTVSISIKDFDSFRVAKEKTDKQFEGVQRAAKELEVFLSFICTRESMQEHIDEFNRQSITCSISIRDGRAKIQFKEKDETD
jgi:hypothetical protein